MAKRAIIGVIISAVLIIGIAAPAFTGTAGAAAPAIHVAGAAQSHATFLDKTRFLIHMGLAYYALHHFVWARYKQHGFDKGAPHRVSNFVKAAIAVLFTYHELKVAYNIAKNSHSGLLHALIAPLNALIGKANSVSSSLKSGHYNASDLFALNGAVDAFGNLAGGKGYTIKDLPAPVPGL